MSRDPHDRRPELPPLEHHDFTAELSVEDTFDGGRNLEVLLAQVRQPSSSRLSTHGEVAAGGMGSIELVSDMALERYMAMKVLHPELRHTESSLRRFVREARITGRLDHPNIVPVYDLGERPDGVLYFTMKLVEGRTLKQLIEELPDGPILDSILCNLLDLVVKVCEALSFAHSRGVLHCDIKPDNVMVGDFGEVYLMDWGIARTGEPSEIDAEATINVEPAALADPPSPDTAHSVLGTPMYMSPEQAMGKRGELDARSDVFLAGGLIYEILTRKPPYHCAQSSLHCLALAVKGTYPKPTEVMGAGMVPPELERIVLKAMAPDRAHRYLSIAGLKHDLTRFLRGGAEFPRTEFAAGEVIVREGDPGDAAYIIELGHCQVSQRRDEQDVPLLTLGPGQVFGELALMAGGLRMATVTAIEPTRVMVVTGAAFEQELAAMKPWTASLLRALADRLRSRDLKPPASGEPDTSPRGSGFALGDSDEITEVGLVRPGHQERAGHDDGNGGSEQSH